MTEGERGPGLPAICGKVPAMSWLMGTFLALGLCVAAHADPPPLPVKGAEPASGAELLPAPQSLAEIPAGVARADAGRGSKAALLEAAAILRRKAALFRTGKCSADELRASAAGVSRAAAAYRLAVSATAQQRRR